MFEQRHYSYHLLWGGSLISSFSLFMLSLTKPGHFYQVSIFRYLAMFSRNKIFHEVFLTQAVGAGIGAGMLYVPSVSLISQYFKRRRSSVMTFVAAGSSLGSVIHPIMLNNTLGKIGFANATRANAGLIAGLYLIACLLMRTRLPPPKNIPDMTKVVKKFSRDKPLVVASIGYVLLTFTRIPSSFLLDSFLLQQDYTLSSFTFS
jgi:MFS family permease